MAGNSVRFSAQLDDKVSSKLDKLRERFDKLGGPGSSAVAFGAVGALGVAKGFSLIGSAADAAVGFLGDAVNAAIDNQASIQKLSTALRNNIPAWDGNTAAIEDTISAREKLGFSDDEQRNSLALLAGVTHNVTEAMDIQRTAMDLARLKGIDLATATDALIKAHNGNYKALKAVGVEIDANMTSTEALARVQAIARGQAEDYANTTAGKLATAQVAIGEAMEKLGNVILPAVSSALGVVADAAFAASDALDSMTHAQEGAVEVSHPLVAQTGKLTDAEVKAALAFDRVGESADKALAHGIPRATHEAVTATADGTKNIVDHWQHVVDAYTGVIDAEKKVKTEIPKLEKALAHAHGLEAERIKAEIALLKAEAAAAKKALYIVQALPSNNRPDPNNTRARSIGGPTVIGLRSASGVTIQGVSERELVDMVDRGLYFRLRRAAPTLARS